MSCLSLLRRDQHIVKTVKSKKELLLAISLSFEIECTIQADVTATWYHTLHLCVLTHRYCYGKKKKKGQKVLSWSRSKSNSQSYLLLFMLTILKGEDTHCWTRFAMHYDYNNEKELCIYLGKVNVVF